VNRPPWSATRTSYSELDTLATCEQRWQYRYPLGTPSAPTDPMKFGTVMHSACAHWWVNHEWPTLEQVYLFEDLEPMSEELESKALWLFDRYARYYAPWIGHVEIIAHELELEVPFHGLTLTCHIDAIWKVGDLTWAVERKTMRDWRRMSLVHVSPQETMYLWMLRESGYEVHGAYFDAIKTYRWALEKPTQAALIEEAGNEGRMFTTKKAATEWARGAVERHPGIEKKDPSESFNGVWLQRTPQQLLDIELWMASIIDRRAQLLEAATPIRNIGNECQSCSHQEQCFDSIGFPPLTIELADELD